MWNMHGMQEVGGSIPPGSTNKNKDLLEACSLCFRPEVQRQVQLDEPGSARPLRMSYYLRE